VEVGNLSEEVGTKAFVRLDEHAVLVRVVSGRGVLAEEGSLPNEVALSTLSGGRLLGLLVVGADEVLHVTFNLNNVKHNAVGVSGEGALVVEKVVEGGLRKGSVLLLDFGDNNGVGGDGLGELCGIRFPVIGNRLREGGSKLGGMVEVKNIGVVGEGKNVLVRAGLVTGGGADVHNLACTEVRELELKSKNVPGIGTVRNLKFVGVFVHFVD